MIVSFLFLTQEKGYSQVNSNCTVNAEEVIYSGNTYFPDWDKVPYQNVKVKSTSSSTGLIVSLDFTVIGTFNQVSNWYTNSDVLTGVDNSSMLEFARMDIVQKLIYQVPCNFSITDTFTITILQRTPCWKARYCRIPILSKMCCNPVEIDPTINDSNSNSYPLFNYEDMPGFEYIHQGGENTDAFGNKYYYINAGKSQCGWKCCELKYKFKCKIFNPSQLFEAHYGWGLVGFERKEFENSSCIEDFEYSNPNCPHPQNFNPINPCTGDCNENLYEKN